MQPVSKYIRLAAILAAMGGMFASCDKDLWEFSDKDRGAYESDDTKPIASMLDEMEGYSEWVKVLNYSQLYSTLNARYDSKSQVVKFTMFAPDDEALNAFYTKKGVSSIEELGSSYADAMVRTMTYSGDSVRFSEKFSSVVTDIIYTMEAGESVTVSIDGNQRGFLLNDAIHFDYDPHVCSNGFIYETKGVVTPLVESIWARLTESGNSSIMQQALKETGYDQVLNKIADTTIVLGSHKYTRHYYSLLNVSDEVFHKAGISSLDDLKHAIATRNTNAAISQDAQLRQYVQYHILDSRYSLDELSVMNGEDTVAVSSNTLAQDQIYMLTRHYLDDASESDIRPFVTLVNNDDIAGQAFDTSHSDIVAKNGYLHNLTNWMPVYEPKQSTVVWDLADYSQVREAVGEEHYRPANYETNETKVDLTRLSCFTVEVPNGRANTDYSELCYVTCKSNLKGCKYNDRVVFNMGYLGSVSMKTPTLVKGKYRVSVSVAYLVTQNIMVTSSGCKGGLLKVLVDLPEDFDAMNDDESAYRKVLVAPYTQLGKSPSAGVYTSTLYDEIEFDTTSSHTFKFVIMDPAASQNAKVFLQFDTITFTPIE